MALALEGVDLVVIALFLFLLAFLHATKWTIQPLVGVLHSALGWVPFVGDLITRADHAVINALNVAIADTEEVISTLWAGLVWSFNELIDGLSTAWTDIAGAFEHGFTVSIPNAFHGLWSDVQHAGTVAGKVTTGVEQRIVATLKEAQHYAAGEATHAINVAGRYTDTWIDKLRIQLTTEITSVSTTVDGLVDAAKHAVTAPEAAAAGTVSTITKLVTEQLPAEISSLASELAAAEGAVAGELPRLPGLALDEIEQLLRSKEFGTLAGLLAAIPLVNAFVHALASEAGLSNAECRGKVKQICASNPLRWAHLLEGLALVIAFPSLDEFADACADAVDEVAGVLFDFLGLAR